MFRMNVVKAAANHPHQHVVKVKNPIPNDAWQMEDCCSIVRNLPWGDGHSATSHKKDSRIQHDASWLGGSFEIGRTHGNVTLPLNQPTDPIRPRQSLQFEKSSGGAAHLQREPWPWHCASPPEQEGFLQSGREALLRIRV